MTTEEKIAELKRKNPPSKHLNGKFEVVGVIPGPIDMRGKTYDLRTITLEKAEELAKMKCPYLKRVETSSGKPAEKDSPKGK